MGGVLHALEALTKQEVSAAISGYRYFGLDAATALLIEISATDDPDEAACDRRYGESIPTDDVLAQAFENKLKSIPKDFAPVARTPSDRSRTPENPEHRQ